MKVYGEVKEGKMEHFKTKIEKWSVSKLEYEQLLEDVTLPKEIKEIEK